MTPPGVAHRPSPPPTEEREVRSSFVGRERELAELSRGLQEAAAGRGRLFVVTGEPGIGKTRLADELSRLADEAGAAVVWGRCWEGGGAPAYWMWIQVLRACLFDAPQAVPEQAADGATDLAQLVPDLAERLGAASPAGEEDVERGRFRIFDAVTRLLKRAAATRPLVLVLDDLHAADRPSLALLEFFARELRDARILTVVTYREAEARRQPDLADRLAAIGRAAQQIPLRGLAAPAVARLVAAACGTEVTDELVSAVYQATDGNPFFVDEVLRLFVAEGRQDGRFAIPDGVRAAIRRRIAPLSPACTSLLDVAAVLGREFALVELVSASDRQADELLDLLAEARSAGLVAEVPGSVARWAFAHALVRETLYDDLPPAVRVRRHRRIAEALETLYGADPEPHLPALAHHYCGASQGGDVGKALDYSIRAARRATALHAWEEAAALYRRALAVAALGGIDDARRCEVLLALGEAEECGDQFARAKVTFEQAAEVARVLGKPELLARAALGIGGQWARKFTSGVMDRGEPELLEEALVALGGMNPSLRARLLGRLALRLRFSANPARVEMLSQEALATARAVGDPHELGWAVSFRHACLLGPERLDQKMALADEMLAIAEQIGDHDLMLRAHALRTHDLGEIGELERRDEELDRYSRLAVALRDPFDDWMSRMYRAMVLLSQGKFEQGEQLSHEAVTVANRVPGQQTADHNAGMCFAAQAFLLALERGDFESGEELLAQFVDRYPTVVTLRAFRIRMRIGLGRTADAIREFDAIAANDFGDLPKDSLWLSTGCVLAEAAADLRLALRAATLYSLLERYAGRIVMVASPACLGSSSRYLGLLAATMGRSELAERHFRAARAENEALGLLPWLAWTLYDHALVAAARDRDESAALRSEARVLAMRLGMVRLAGLASPPSVESGLAARVSPAPAEPPAEAVFRREGELWTIAFNGRVSHLKHAKGLAYLSMLLASPGCPIPAMDMVAVAHEPHAEAPRVSTLPGTVSGLSVRGEPDGDGEALVDGAARNAYRARLREVRAELEQAGAFQDFGRSMALKAEEEALVEEIARSVGLGGRARRTGSASERARLNVSRAIRVALDRIAARDAALGEHLARTVTTGFLCCYAPDPRAPLAWVL